MQICDATPRGYTTRHYVYLKIRSGLVCGLAAWSCASLPRCEHEPITFCACARAADPQPAHSSGRLRILGITTYYVYVCIGCVYVCGIVWQCWKNCFIDIATTRRLRLLLRLSLPVIMISGTLCASTDKQTTPRPTALFTPLSRPPLYPSLTLYRPSALLILSC